MGELTINDMKPTARAVKDQEMAIRRAYQLNAGLLRALTKHKTVDAVIEYWRSTILEDKDLRQLFTYPSIEWRDKEAWTWAVRHWFSGGLKRSVETSMCNITDTNRKNIKHKLEQLHG